MPRTITLDPVTRIEGHLRIDVEVDGDHVTKGDQLRLMDLIGNGLEHLGVDVVYSEVKGVQVIEDRRMRGI